MTETEALAAIRVLYGRPIWRLNAREVLPILNAVDGKSSTPLPAIPGRGDRVRLLCIEPESEPGQADLDIVILQPTSAGLWYTPADDAPSAHWIPWTHVLELWDRQ